MWLYALYLHSIVWEGDSQQVIGRTGVTVLDHAQTVRSDLQQHVRRLHVKHLRRSDRKKTNQGLLSLGTMTRQQQEQEGQSEPCGVRFFCFFIRTDETYNYTDPHPNHVIRLYHTFRGLHPISVKLYIRNVHFAKCSPEQHSWLHIWCVCLQQSRCCTSRKPLRRSL